MAKSATYTLTEGEFTSTVKGFSKGGAYITAPRQFLGRKVKVIVLPEDKE